MTETNETKLVAPISARVLPDEIGEREFTHYETGLSPLGDNYDPYAMAVHDACLRKTAKNLGIAYSPDLDIVCRTCLYHTRMPGIYMRADGRCNMCHAFEDGLKRAVKDGRLASELKAALDPSETTDKSCDVIVALSGGKDSSAVLGYVAQELGLRTVAVLVDNQFIPDYVKENCATMCAQVGAEFVVLDFDFRPEIRQLMKAEQLEFVPCNVCSKRFKKLITDYATEIGCHRVLTGRNTWATIEPEVSGERLLKAYNDTIVSWYCLPFLLRWRMDDITSRLNEIKWNQRNKNIPGNSTNCLVPGMIGERFESLSGINADTALIADEVIVGFISRSEGLEIVTED